ncbi:MAG: MFS transporter [Thermodesulfobacteriota bacterium]|nr:MFS transporter [Thermodesulfobacteriota bacterium]
MAESVLAKKSFYGWKALSGAMIVYFCGCGILFYSFGVFMPAMCDALSWTRSAVAGAFSLFIIMMGLLGPVVGITVARFGPRKNIVIGNIVAIIGLAGLFFTQKTWHFYLFYGALVGIGNAFGLFIPATTIANNWFIRKRALALSLVTASGGLGGLLFPPLIITPLISKFGWQFAWLFLAAIHLVLAIFVGGLLIRNTPEEIGQVPDGLASEAPGEETSAEVHQSKVYQTPVEWETGQAVRTLPFWLIMIFSVANVFALNIMVVHQVAHLEDIGFSRMIAASALGLLPGMSIIGRLGVGALATRFEARYLASICILGQIIAVSIFMKASSLPLIYIYALIFGICYGGLIVLLPTFFGSYYGRESYPKVLGLNMLFVTLLGAIAPPLGGAIKVATGSYTTAFLILIVLLAIGLVCAFFAKPPKPKMQ